MAKEKIPNASEKETLEAVLRNRTFLQNPARLKLTEEEINKKMQNINSLNDLIEYFLRKEKIEREKFRFIRDIFGIGKMSLIKWIKYLRGNLGHAITVLLFFKTKEKQRKFNKSMRGKNWENKIDPIFSQILELKKKN